MAGGLREGTELQQWPIAVASQAGVRWVQLLFLGSPCEQIFAELGLTGVVFNQGVNEMQTLANMSGGESSRQVEVLPSPSLPR
jgi:hypothetical protein